MVRHYHFKSVDSTQCRKTELKGFKKMDKPQRNERGHFIEGNTISEKSKGIRSLYGDDRKKIRAETIKCALILSEKRIDLEAKFESPNISNMEYLTINSILKKDYKFIQWLLEMAIGKPKVSANITTQQTSLENLILGREQEHGEDIQEN